VGPAGAPSTCLGWPPWLSVASLARSYGSFAIVQYCAAALATVLIVMTVIHAWRSWRSEPAILCVATLAAALFFSGMLASELAAARAMPMLLLGLRVGFASGTWSLLAALLSLSVQLPVRRAEPRPAAGRRLKDLVLLTRPTVVLLLVASAIAGAVVGTRSIPPLGLMGWMLLGLVLATGGAQALNQYIERDTDARMTRTAGRPLPSGRLTSAEALAWALGLCVAGLAVMATLVSWLASLLTLAGILWYVLLYTMVLKRRTPQSIVLGGLAGGILPLIGCIAVTGGVSAASLFLSVSIFFWTPPHFWSFSLLHLQDYAKAGVPVAPLVVGAQRAGNSILAYAAALVISTFFPVMFRTAGLVYLCAAVLLGGVLLATTWSTLRHVGRGSTLGLYRLLSLYLGVLLVASVVDSLV
jgi:heme o synthase